MGQEKEERAGRRGRKRGGGQGAAEDGLGDRMGQEEAEKKEGSKKRVLKKFLFRPNPYVGQEMIQEISRYSPFKRPIIFDLSTSLQDLQEVPECYAGMS